MNLLEDAPDIDPIPGHPSCGDGNNSRNHNKISFLPILSRFILNRKKSQSMTAILLCSSFKKVRSVDRSVEAIPKVGFTLKPKAVLILPNVTP